MDMSSGGPVYFSVSIKFRTVCTLPSQLCGSKDSFVELQTFGRGGTLQLSSWRELGARCAANSFGRGTCLKTLIG